MQQPELRRGDVGSHCGKGLEDVPMVPWQGCESQSPVRR